MKVLSLCDGISAGLIASEQVFGSVEYWAIEIDKHARKISDANLPDIIRPCNDVNEVTARQMLFAWPSFDWVIFGSPCQSVSVAGKGEGLDGASGLLFKCMEILSLARWRNPNVKYLIENVKMKKEFQEQFNRIIGHEPELICASLVSAQMRKRLYWTNFKVSQPEDRCIFIKDVLDGDGFFSDKEKSFCVDACYHKGGNTDTYIKKGRRQLLFKYSESNRYKTESGETTQYASEAALRIVEKRLIESDKSLTLTTGEGCGSGMKSINLVQDDKMQYRKLTVRECARLQTFPEWFSFECVSKTQAYKALGNSWCIEVIKHIFKESLK